MKPYPADFIITRVIEVMIFAIGLIIFMMI
jgi:hypothetical protein